MGWCRNNHAYYFKPLPKPKQNHVPPHERGVGVAFGPIRAHTVDMMHCLTHRIFMADDTKVKLGQLLQKVGQKLEYVYDIGDQFRHKLVVEKIEDGHNGIIELLDGERESIPEDSGGLFSYAEKLEILKDKNHPKYQETYAECQRAVNYRGRKFIPYFFDKKQTNRNLQVALKSESSKQDDSHMFHYDYTTGKIYGGFEGDYNEKIEKKCVVCGKTKGLKKCSRCKIAFYCGVEHQKQDWPNHKKVCSKLAK